MDSIITNAPTNQFARKAYFWKQVNNIKNQTGLPSNTGYRFFNAIDLEAEYRRLSKRKVQQNVARQATRALQKRQMKQVAKQVAQIAQTRRLVQEQKEEKEHKEDLYNNQINEYINLRNPQRLDVFEFKLVDLPLLNIAAEMLRTLILPNLRSNSMVRVFDGTNFININSAPLLIQDRTNIHDYFELAQILIRILNQQYYGNSLIIQIIPIITTNPKLNRLYDGFYNCAIAPVIYHLAQLTQDKNNKCKINKLKKLNNKVLEEKNGANEDIIQQIAEISKFKLSIVDKMKIVWKEFEPLKAKQKKNTNILMEVKGNHLVSKYEEQLNEIKTEGYIFSVKFHLVEFNKFKDKKIEWHSDLTEIATLNPTADVISSKNSLLAVILQDKIHKKIFNEYEKYPDAFGDGGVGKAKFLEQNPQFQHYKPNKYDSILLESDIKGIYYRTKKSNPNNFKYDHNHSYKSFKQSGIYKKIPVIDGCCNINRYVSELDEKLLDKNGLFFIDKELDDDYELDKKYYDSNGWYPIEIVKEYYLVHNQNPMIKQMMFGTDTFDIDETKMTNAQFRTFIGKTYSQNARNTWRTNNYSEFLRARYILKDNILNINENDGVYSVTYKKNTPQWCMPIIYTYVLRHQNFIMQSFLRKLNQIPVHVCVDGIELEKKSNIFPLGSLPGQWKLEKINMKVAQNPFELKPGHSYKVPNCLNYEEIEDMIKLIENNKYIHIGGAGGNGKTHKLKQLANVYGSAGVCATTHQAVRELNNTDAKTFYAMLNIKNEQPTYIRPLYLLDECSMLNAENLLKIIEKAPNSKIILFGDFCQLPVVEGTNIDDHEIYEQFTKIELTKNWRQEADPEFYDLCCKLRNGLTYDESIKIINTLNTRVLKLPSYNTKDDIYICGINSQVDAINSKFKLENGCKVIATKTEMGYVNGLKGIYMNGNVNWNDGTHTDKPKHIEKNYSSTIHKAQGSTYSGNVIIDPSRLFEKNHLYVALTRATNFKNIYLTQPININTFVQTCYVDMAEYDD